MSSGAGAGAGGWRITIRSISCRGVRAFVPFQKPPLYAAVSLGGRRVKTPADTNGGENPDWDGAAVAFDLDDGGGQEQMVQFEVKAQGPLLGNKLVGTAGVPVAHLTAGGGGGDGAALRHVSYQVSAPDGKPNGTLSFAYAISGGAGGVGPQPQLYPMIDGARPEQGPSFCCVPPPPPPQPSAPPTANIAPHSGGYPRPVSSSFYPSQQDLLAPSSYPPPPPPPPAAPLTAYPPPPASCTACPAPPAQYTSSYPPPPESCTACPAPPSQYISSYPPPPTNYPPPPASCAACPAPPSQYISGYPPPPTNYPPPPPNGYPPLASNSAPPTSTYPPLESGSAYPTLPRSAPSSVDRSLGYYPAPPSQDAAITYPPPSGDSYYPPPGARHPALDGAGRTPYYYPPPGTRSWRD